MMKFLNPLNWFRREPPAPPPIRNKPGGMAWISAEPFLDGRPAGVSVGANALLGRAVRCVRQVLVDGRHLMWELDPPQKFISTKDFTYVCRAGRYPIKRGAVVEVPSLRDDMLTPWREDDGGVTEEEVRELNASNLVRPVRRIPREVSTK